MTHLQKRKKTPNPDVSAKPMTFDELLKQRMSRRQALGRTAAAAIGAGVIAAGAGGYFALTQLGQRPTTVTTPTATVTTPTATVTTPTATVTTPTATTTAPGQVVDLDFVIWTWGVELVQEHVNRFNQAHTTEINVGLSDIAQETYREGLIAKFTGGSPIDLMYSSTEWQTEFEVAGWVTPTEDLFPEVRKYYELIAPGFRPGVLTRDGKMHGLLYYGDHTNFVVNREHLKQIGVEPDPLKSPTWDEVRGWAVELKNKGVAEYPMAAFLGSYGFWQTFSTFVMGQNDPIDQQGIKWIFDEDLNPVMEQNSPIFNAIRWLMDVANTDKTFQPASVNYGDPDIINNVGAGIHSIAWVPTYDFGPINDPANKEGGNIQNVLQPGTGIASAWERPYNVGTTNAKRDRAAQEAMWKLQVFFGGKTDEDLNPVENPTTEGVFRVNKRIMTEVAVPTPYPSLLDDPEYNAAIAKFADPEVYLAQLNKAVVHQVDGEQVPWWGEWSGGWGLGFARVEINGLILGQKGLADSDIMAVLNNIAARWQEYKQSFGGTY